LTTNITRKAELNLLFADKRIGASRILFENKKSEFGIFNSKPKPKNISRSGIFGKRGKWGGGYKGPGDKSSYASFKYRQEKIRCF
jgi:hypothetical protein